jgi:hypothetical protein
MKFYLYAVVLVGIMIILNAAGLETPSGSLVKTFDFIEGTGTDKTVTLENFKNSQLWSNSDVTDAVPGLTYLLIGAVVAGLVLGAFGRTPDIRYLTAAMVFALTGFLASDVIFLFVQLNSYGIAWLTWGAGAILGALLVGLFITALEFWQGTD